MSSPAMNIYSFEEFPTLSRQNTSSNLTKTSTTIYDSQDVCSLFSTSSLSASSTSLSISPSNSSSQSSTGSQQMAYFLNQQVKLKIDSRPNCDFVQQMKDHYWLEDPAIADKKIKAGLDRFNRAYAAIPCNPKAAFSHAPLYQDGMAPYFTGFH